MNGVKLGSLRDCQKTLSKLANEVLRDRIPESKARTIGYLIKIALKVYELERLSQLEERLRILETKLGDRA